MDLSKLIKKATGQVDPEPVATLASPTEVKVEPTPIAAIVEMPVTPTESEIVETIFDQIPTEAEMCDCTHPEDAHDENGECTILECMCLCFFHTPKSSSSVSPATLATAKLDTNVGETSSAAGALPKDTNEPVSAVDGAPAFSLPTQKVPKTYKVPDLSKLVSQTVGNTTAMGLVPKATNVKPFVISSSDVAKASQEIGGDGVGATAPSLGTGAEQEFSPDACVHMCESCDKWFSHGLKAKCRHFDVVRFGKCDECLNPTLPEISPGEEMTEGQIVPGFVNGKLTVRSQIDIRNKTRLTCQNMTIQQLTVYIETLQYQIQSYMTAGIEARAMRTQLEEDEIGAIPESEREAFRQALRRGQQKGEKKPRAQRKAKEPAEDASEAGRMSKLERAISNMMRTTGKTRKEVEAFLAD